MTLRKHNPKKPPPTTTCARGRTWLTAGTTMRKPWARHPRAAGGHQLLVRVKAEGFHWARRLKHMGQSVVTDNGCPHCGRKRDALPHVMFQRPQRLSHRGALDRKRFGAPLDQATPRKPPRVSEERRCQEKDQASAGDQGHEAQACC